MASILFIFCSLRVRGPRSVPTRCAENHCFSDTGAANQTGSLLQQWVHPARRQHHPVTRHLLQATHMHRLLRQACYIPYYKSCFVLTALCRLRAAIRGRASPWRPRLPSSGTGRGRGSGATGVHSAATAAPAAGHLPAGAPLHSHR
jgi:hypothetical protein